MVIPNMQQSTGPISYAAVLLEVKKLYSKHVLGDNNL